MKQAQMRFKSFREAEHFLLTGAGGVMIVSGVAYFWLVGPRGFLEQVTKIVFFGSGLAFLFALFSLVKKKGRKK